MSVAVSLTLSVALGAFLILFLRVASEKRIKIVLRITSLIFLAVCIFRFIKNKDVFDSVVKLNTLAVSQLGVVTKSEGLYFVILRWLTMYSVLFGILAPWYKIKTIDNFMAIFTPVIYVLNLISMDLTFTCFIGANGFSWSNPMAVLRVVQFTVELGIMGGMAAYYLYHKIKTKDWKHILKQLSMMLLILLIYLPFTMPESSITNIFGYGTFLKNGFFNLGGKDDYSYYVMSTFDLGNRLLLYSMVIFSALAYAFLRNREKQIRHFAMTSVALGVLISFCYVYTLKFSVTSLPLHLCNAGTVLIFFAFAFNNKPLFYFNFLVNVLGSAIAIIACNTNGDFLSYIGVHYYLTHCCLCILPCLGMALKLFERPNFKLVVGAVAVFSIYFFLMCILNPWFNNYAHGAEYLETGKNPGIDYFYVMSDFLPDKFELAKDLKENFTYSFMIRDLKFWVYPVFWAVVYVVYVAGIFGIWYLYALLFKVGDRHYDMLMRKRKARADLLNIGAIKINMETSEPLNKEGIHMIKFSHFTKCYGNSKVKAVDDFSLEINDGEVFGFLGHNGAGKSTCIKSLVGIQSITGGSIEICGFDIAKQPLPAKRLMGYVPDNHAVYERLTGREYINYVADLYMVSKEDRETRLERYLNIFKLKGDIDRQIKGYSHGMKQKIVVIAALIHEPKVWVLDEPLTGLDPTSSFQIKECMREHANKGNIVFFSSHVIEVVEKICDRIAIISKGKLQCVHQISDLKASGISLEQLYMQYIESVDQEMLKSEDISGREVLKQSEDSTEQSENSTATKQQK